MQKKIWVKPKVEVIKFENHCDIITCSGDPIVPGHPEPHNPPHGPHGPGPITPPGPGPHHPGRP